MAEQDAQVPVTDVMRFVIPVFLDKDRRSGLRTGNRDRNFVKMTGSKCRAVMDEDGNIKLTGQKMSETKVSIYSTVVSS